jgi:hypothetical protein
LACTNRTFNTKELASSVDGGELLRARIAKPNGDHNAFL